MASRRPPDAPRPPVSPRASESSAATPVVPGAPDAAPKRRRAATQPNAGTGPAGPSRSDGPALSTAVKDRAEIAPEARRAMIAEAAYLRAQARGFMPGYELEDWLAAESEIDALLRAGQGGPAQ